MQFASAIDQLVAYGQQLVVTATIAAPGCPTLKMDDLCMWATVKPMMDDIHSVSRLNSRSSRSCTDCL